MEEKHEHKFGKWTAERVLYTRTARLDGGEVRVCEECGTAEFRDFKATKRSAVINPTIGLYAAVFNEKGQIFASRRPPEMKTSVGEWELLGGGAKAERVSLAKNERIVGEEVAEIVKEKVGLEIRVDLLPPPMYPVILAGGGDWAFVLPAEVVRGVPKIELTTLSPRQVVKFAEGPEGNRIVSGKKRMYQLFLLGLAHFSPNEEYRMQAFQMIPQRY